MTWVGAGAPKKAPVDARPGEGRRGGPILWPLSNHRDRIESFPSSATADPPLELIAPKGFPSITPS